MEYQFSHLPIEQISLSRMSKTGIRAVSFIASFGIVVLFAVSIMKIGGAYIDEAGYLIIATAVLSVLGYLKSKKIYPYLFLEWLADQTPVGVIVKHDTKIVLASKAALFEHIDAIDLKSCYLAYVKIDPALRSTEAFEIVVKQENGTLNDWANENFDNHKALTLLIERMHLIEQEMAAEKPF